MPFTMKRVRSFIFLILLFSLCIFLSQSRAEYRVNKSLLIRLCSRARGTVLRLWCCIDSKSSRQKDALDQFLHSITNAASWMSVESIPHNGWMKWANKVGSVYWLWQTENVWINDHFECSESISRSRIISAWGFIIIAFIWWTLDLFFTLLVVSQGLCACIPTTQSIQDLSSSQELFLSLSP